MVCMICEIFIISDEVVKIMKRSRLLCQILIDLDIMISIVHVETIILFTSWMLEEAIQEMIEPSLEK